jgi:hypothetical protein
MRFVEVWPDQTEVTTLAQHLGWSHFKEILYLDSELARQFYAEWVFLLPGHPIQFVIPRSSRNEAPWSRSPCFLRVPETRQGSEPSAGQPPPCCHIVDRNALGLVTACEKLEVYMERGDSGY